MATYTVFTKDFDRIFKKINRVANKCSKANIPVVFTYSDPYERIISINNNSYSFSLTDITVDCSFKYNGWTALGMVQRKDGIIQCYFKDPSLIPEYSTTDFHCDHCKKNVYRNSVVILQHESGSRKIVGTSCVQEFTCGLNGNLIAEFADLSNLLENNSSRLLHLNDSEIIEESEGIADIVSYGTIIHNVEKVVSCASHLINNYGFRTSNDDEATCKYIPDCMEHYNRVTEEEKEEARKAISWILNLSQEEKMVSSYIFNVYKVCEAEYCTSRYYGLLASLIPTYRKHLAKSNQENNHSSKHIGEIGNRITTNVTIIKRLCFDSVYGNCWIILMKDNDGNILKWTTSKRLSEEYKEGYETKVTGTIKDHDLYRGEKQTSITRCKFSC